MDLVFEDLRVGKFLECWEVGGVAIQSIAWYEAHDLSSIDFNSQSISLTFDRVVDLSHSGYFVIKKIHRHRKEPARMLAEPQRFHKRQSAVSCSNRARDLTRGRQIVAARDHVERDEDFSCTYCNRAC